MSGQDPNSGGLPISAAKTAANQANAQKSTGPKTIAGKARSCANAVTHGFFAKAIVLPGEDLAAYEALRDQVFNELQPRNGLEAVYTKEIVDTHWRLQRLAAIEASVFTRRAISFSGDDCGTGFAFINDAQGLNTFAKLCQYEGTLTRRLHKALEQLRKLRQEAWPNYSESEERVGTTQPMNQPEPSQVTECVYNHQQPSAARDAQEVPVNGVGDQSQAGPPVHPVATEPGAESTAEDTSSVSSQLPPEKFEPNNKILRNEANPQPTFGPNPTGPPARGYTMEQARTLGIVQ